MMLHTIVFHLLKHNSGESLGGGPGGGPDGDPRLLTELHCRKKLLQESLPPDLGCQPFEAGPLQDIEDQVRGILEVQEHLKWLGKDLAGLLAEALDTKSLPPNRPEVADAFAKAAQVPLAGRKFTSLRQAADHVQTMLDCFSDEIHATCRPKDVMYVRFEELAQALQIHNRNSPSFKVISQKISDMNKHLATIAGAISQRTPAEGIVARALVATSHVLIALKACGEGAACPGSQSNSLSGANFAITQDPLDQLCVWALNISRRTH